MVRVFPCPVKNDKISRKSFPCAGVFYFVEKNKGKWKRELGSGEGGEGRWWHVHTLNGNVI